MKRISLPILLGLLLATTVSFAQDFKLGPKVGLNIANQGGDADSDARIGFNAGVTGLYSLSDKFSVGADVIYSLQGANYEMTTGVGETDTKPLNASYINVPIYAQFYPVADLGLDVKAGIQPGFMLSAEYDGEDFSDFYKSFDLGIPVGVGYELDNGLAFDVRYAIGVLNISDLDDDSNVTNQVFQVNVAYRFSL